MMYPHYYNLNIISRFTNQEKMITNLKDHFKEFTFKPKINKESANLDFQNISQVYAKLQEEKQKKDKEIQFKQAKQKTNIDADVEEPNDSSEDDKSQIVKTVKDG